MLALAAQAAPDRTWNGPVNGDWFIPSYWSPDDNYPQPGEAVAVTNGSVLLTNDTAELSSLTISNGTVVCSNWATRLFATTVALRTNGVITLPSAFTDFQMSNRVSIVCTDLTIDAGGSINANYKGFAGGTATAYGNGPGKGTRGASTSFGGGAGHGGHGGTLNPQYGIGDWGGISYDILNAPEGPGSGGCGAANGHDGGHGGGAICIQASGSVAVNGTITANGYTAGNGGGGSGGSIWISCQTLSGNSAVTAYGGTSASSGGGGGGRIALCYGALGAPATLRVSAKPGFGCYSYVTAVDSRAGGEAEQGTVYLSDTNLLGPVIDNISGRVTISNVTSLTVSSLTVTNAAFGIDNNFSLTVLGDLRVQGSGSIFLSGTNSQTMVNGAVRLQSGGQAVLWGDLTCSNDFALESAMVGGLVVKGNLLMNIGGNLVLTNGSSVYIGSGRTNGLGRDYGVLVGVTGTVTLATNSWIYPYSHQSDGGSCLFRMGALNVGSNAGFNADGRGYYGSSTVGYGPGYGTRNGSYGSGAGHGGKGGNGSTFTGGIAYDSTNAPLSAGSGGGPSGGGVPSRGGGLIRLEVMGDAMLEGTLTAKGNDGSSSAGNGGGSSGGGIFLICGNLVGSSYAVIRADGGAGSLPYGGGGGGGRIAVWYRVPANRMPGILDGSDMRNVIITNLCNTFLGSISMTNGLGYTNAPPGGAEPGSFMFLTVSRNGMLVQIR